MTTHLLTPEDLEFINSTGVRVERCEDLFAVLPDKRVVFTVKGLQYFREACRVHGFDWSSLRLKTEADVVHFGYQLSTHLHHKALGELELVDGAPPRGDELLVAAALTGDDLTALLDILERPAPVHCADVIQFPAKSRPSA